MDTTRFPAVDWARTSPAEAGMDRAGLERADRWIEEVIGDRPYRFVVARGGAIVYERYRASPPRMVSTLTRLRVLKEGSGDHLSPAHLQ